MKTNVEIANQVSDLLLEFKPIYDGLSQEQRENYLSAVYYIIRTGEHLDEVARHRELDLHLLRALVTAFDYIVVMDGILKDFRTSHPVYIMPGISDFMVRENDEDEIKTIIITRQTRMGWGYFGADLVYDFRQVTNVCKVTLSLFGHNQQPERYAGLIWYADYNGMWARIVEGNPMELLDWSDRQFTRNFMFVRIKVTNMPVG